MDRLNLDYNLDKRSFPAHILIETSTICDLKCPICPYPILERPKGIISREIFQKIVDEVANIDNTTVIWPELLGEPLLLGEYFFSLVDYVKERNLTVCVNTNGMHIKDNLKNILSSEIDKIYISVDGATNLTYDKIKVGGDFRKVVQNVHRLLKEKPDSMSIIVQFIETEENKHEVSAFRTYWLEHGAVVKIRRKLGWGSV